MKAATYGLCSQGRPGCRYAHPGYEELQMTVADMRSVSRVSKNAPAKSRQDLRAWLEELRAAGEVQEINGAERENEIGGIVDLHMRKMGNPAVLFDDIPGYP